jgi:hypothetical protein
MQKFFFDMIDGVPFRDRIGIEFKTNADAIAHCGVLARHFFDGSLKHAADRPRQLGQLAEIPVPAGYHDYSP